MDDRLDPVPQIDVRLYGEVAPAIFQEIEEEITACYRSLRVPLPGEVRLSIFDTLARWREYTTRRREESGIITAGEEGFLATHEAWEDVPHLNVCLERLRAHAALIQQGALHQVVAHSVLHGRPDYYRFQIPRALIDASRARGIEIEVVQQVLYFVAIAIKGHEAVLLLAQHGFLDDQIALALHQLQKDEDDIVIWRMARWEPRARLLYLSAQIKPLLYMQPLLPYAPMLNEAARTALAHLPPEDIGRLEALVETLATECSGDTHQDVSMALVLVLSRL